MHEPVDDDPGIFAAVLGHDSSDFRGDQLRETWGSMPTGDQFRHSGDTSDTPTEEFGLSLKPLSNLNEDG